MANAIRSLVTLTTKDEKNTYRLSIGTYNGKSYITIFSENSNVPASIWLSDTVQHYIKKYLKQVIQKKEPKITNSIVVMKYNEITKTMDKQSIISIGTTEKNIIYFGVNIMMSSNNKVNEDIINKDLKFIFKNPPAVENTDPNFTEELYNLEAAKCVLDIISNKLPIAEISTYETDIEKQAAAYKNSNFNKPNNTQEILF
jgi:hypothetical protein